VSGDTHIKGSREEPPIIFWHNAHRLPCIIKDRYGVERMGSNGWRWERVGHRATGCWGRGFPVEKGGDAARLRVSTFNETTSHSQNLAGFCPIRKGTEIFNRLVCLYSMSSCNCETRQWLCFPVLYASADANNLTTLSSVLTSGAAPDKHPRDIPR
jgi:hypothetical protein